MRKGQKQVQFYRRGHNYRRSLSAIYFLMYQIQQESHYWKGGQNYRFKKQNAEVKQKVFCNFLHIWIDLGF